MTQPRVPREPEPPDPDGRRRPSLLRSGQRVILGDLTQMMGPSWGHRAAWVVLLAAAGVDVATFYQVLVLVMNAPEPVVWGAVIGFTLVALALAHRAGTQAREAVNPRNVVGAKVTALMCIGIWLLLGITAFIVRYVIQAADDGNTSTFIVDGQAQNVGGDSEATAQHLSALLFLVLYLATGMVSSLAGWLRPNPAARMWKRAERKRTKAARRYARSEERLAYARRLSGAISEERQRLVSDWEEAQQQCDHAAVRLRDEAWLMIEARRGPPPRPPRGWPNGGPRPRPGSAAGPAPGGPDADTVVFPSVVLPPPDLPPSAGRPPFGADQGGTT